MDEDIFEESHKEIDLTSESERQFQRGNDDKEPHKRRGLWVIRKGMKCFQNIDCEQNILFCQDKESATM